MMTCGFGAGCYWGVEHAFKMLDGVVDTAVGFQLIEKSVNLRRVTRKWFKSLMMNPLFLSSAY